MAIDAPTNISPSVGFVSKPDFLSMSARPEKDDKKLVVTEETREVEINFKAFHNIPRPATPDPAPGHLSPAPIRYPETLGTLVEVGKSEGKGVGLFATKDILPGRILLCELPLFALLTSDEDALEAKVNELCPEKKKMFMSFTSYINDETDSSTEKVLMERIVDCNSFSIMDETGMGVFETASRINHSCVPNSAYSWRDRVGRMVVYNRFKLLEGEEVTIDYGHKTRALRENYGFECDCGCCTGSESEDET